MSHSPQEVDIEKGKYVEPTAEISSAHESSNHPEVQPYLETDQIDRSTKWGNAMYHSRKLEERLGIEAVSPVRNLFASARTLITPASPSARHRACTSQHANRHSVSG